MCWSACEAQAPYMSSSSFCQTASATLPTGEGSGKLKTRAASAGSGQQAAGRDIGLAGGLARHKTFAALGRPHSTSLTGLRFRTSEPLMTSTLSTAGLTASAIKE